MVGAIFAIGLGCGRGALLQALPGVLQGFFYPGGIARIGENNSFEFEGVAKVGFGFEGVGVDEIAGVGNFKTIFSKEPLVDFHLAFVGFFVFAF